MAVFLDTVVKWLLPRENTFLRQLDAVAAMMAKGAQCFGQFGDAPPERFASIAEELRSIEHEGDALAHGLYDALDKSFVTPIDREDLHDLTAALDDILDYMEECAGLIVIYRLERVTPSMRELIRLSIEAASVVAQCISMLQDDKRHAELTELFVRVHALENDGDTHYRNAIGRLFSEQVDAIELIREKEVLDALERSIDACDDVCDLIRSVVVKNG
jgi:predicted phosphate transport protein (TIGR00153 family)